MYIYVGVYIYIYMKFEDSKDSKYNLLKINVSFL